MDPSKYPGEAVVGGPRVRLHRLVVFELKAKQQRRCLADYEAYLGHPLSKSEFGSRVADTKMLSQESAKRSCEIIEMQKRPGDGNKGNPFYKIYTHFSPVVQKSFKNSSTGHRVQ